MGFIANKLREACQPLAALLWCFNRRARRSGWQNRELGFFSLDQRVELVRGFHALRNVLPQASISGGDAIDDGVEVQQELDVDRPVEIWGWVEDALGAGVGEMDRFQLLLSGLWE
jgi:hypothetical protein